MRRPPGRTAAAGCAPASRGRRRVERTAHCAIARPFAQAHKGARCAAPPDGGAVSFLIRNVPGGLMSSYLGAQAKPGDEIKLAGPQGSFYLREIRRPVLMLAGGTGLAPFLAMLEKIAAFGSREAIAG